MSSSLRRRLTAGLILLLLPLTLAPRTSWTLDAVDYDLVASFARQSAAPKAAVPLRLTVLSRSDEVIEEARLIIDLSLDGKGGAAQLVGASDECVVDGLQAICSVGPVAPRGTASVTVVGRALGAGTLLYLVSEGFSGEIFGTAQMPISTPSRKSPRR